ncbi:hypothetical protein SmJEL517_g01411 [Synchytrium microbalum]|uniref:G-protein coupled receptors family 3 profile domain-containing protein n=1 Tax=Synchytrium microbalum TaxID=1806994 RepID=A0A507CAF4_9FUNG|nr:uncharacterized protein SmJEL517_g01411 [Synchytrium microbalum]TPX36149.1 hypothetical protein SmJEL517_g01411 [Synchytrium microbalum]
MAHWTILENVAQGVFLICIIAISILLGLSLRMLFPMDYTRFLRFAQLILSIGFGIGASFLVGNSDWSDSVCDGVHIFCVILYAGSKVIMYLFLVEKLHIVTSLRTRFEDPLWKMNMVLITPFLGIALLGFFFTGHQFNEDEMNPLALAVGNCEIWYGREFTVPFVAYDVFYSIYISTYFVWAVLGTSKSLKMARNEKYVALAKRNLVGASISLASTFVNVMEMTLNQHQSGTLCLALCSTDTLVNALCLWYVTSSVAIGSTFTQKAPGALSSANNNNNQVHSQNPSRLPSQDPKRISATSITAPRRVPVAGTPALGGDLESVDEEAGSADNMA